MAENQGMESQALELERVAAAARDSLTDEMVGRLSETVAESMDLLDKVNRSGVAGALPAISQLVASGDLERLVHLARAYGAAEDSLTDEMIGRLAETAAESLSIVDRLHRAGLDRLVGALERLASGGAIDRLDEATARLGAGMQLLEVAVRALDTAQREAAQQPGAGGLGGLWRMMRDPENQQTLRFLLAFGREIRKARR